MRRMERRKMAADTSIIEHRHFTGFTHKLYFILNRVLVAIIIATLALGMFTAGRYWQAYYAPKSNALRAKRAWVDDEHISIETMDGNVWTLIVDKEETGPCPLINASPNNELSTPKVTPTPEEEEQWQLKHLVFFYKDYQFAHTIDLVF